MIDSSGRSGLRANGTLFDILPMGRAVAVAGVLLVVLFILSKPEASAGLGWGGRAMFWGLHVGTGLFSLVVASRLLALGSHLPGGTLSLLVVTGLVGVLVATPAYILLDYLFASVVIDADPEPDVTGWGGYLVREILQVAPWFLACWFLINVPVLMPPPKKSLLHNDRVVINEPSPVHSLAEDEPVAQTTPVSVSRVEPSVTLKVVENNYFEPDHPYSVGAPAESKFLLSLPGVIGTDIVAVSSDLHYLNVWTVAGRTTVLGNLRDVVEELGESGMQVHRSHWVAHRHVRRIVGNSREAACIMSNELRVAVSRRRWKAVRDQYGTGVLHTDRDVTDHAREQ